MVEGGSEKMYAAMAEVIEIAFCAICGQDLEATSHFTCHLCGASYCHTHTSKHLNAHPLVAPLKTLVNSK